MSKQTAETVNFYPRKLPEKESRKNAPPPLTPPKMPLPEQYPTEYCLLENCSLPENCSPRKLPPSPFFSNKGNYESQIKLVEKDEVLQDNDLIATVLNKFFKNAVSTLNIKENRFITNRSSDSITDPVDKAIDKYKFHPSTLLIQKHLKNHDVFSFKTVEIGNIEKEIYNINPKKATTSNSSPPKIFKKSSKVSASVLQKLFNDSIEKSDFPQNLKLADITPVYKKNDPLDKTNYRPISILPVVSKIFERIMQKQINDFIISFLSPYLCGCRKGFNTQHALLTPVEN